MSNKRLLFVAGLALALSVLVVPVAFADGGPHGGYTATTDACAGCHRAHTGKGEHLLIETGTIVDFCYACHGISGQGASTDVEGGTFKDPSARNDPTSGLDGNTVGRGLKGGGFATALMDVSYDGSAALTAVTSSHVLLSVGETMWGNGDISATADPGPTTTADTVLTCASCHNPHGNGAYRILRKTPYNSGAGSDVTVSDSAQLQYTVSDPGNKYWAQIYDGTTMSGLNSWCAQCHTRIHATGDDTGSTDSGDAIFTYRHRTDGTSGAPSCLTCHVVHGSTAAADGFAGQVEKPGTAIGGGDYLDSSLLRVDNRGVCQLCHNK